jgi:hypothetical protein
MHVCVCMYVYVLLSVWRMRGHKLTLCEHTHTHYTCQYPQIIVTLVDILLNHSRHAILNITILISNDQPHTHTHTHTHTFHTHSLISHTHTLTHAFHTHTHTHTQLSHKHTHYTCQCPQIIMILAHILLNHTRHAILVSYEYGMHTTSMAW